jgi:hypothetical protein
MRTEEQDCCTGVRAVRRLHQQHRRESHENRCPQREPEGRHHVTDQYVKLIQKKTLSTSSKSSPLAHDIQHYEKDLKKFRQVIASVQ